MDPFVKMMIGVLARAVLVTLSNALIAHDLMKADDQGALVGQGVAWLVDAVPAAIAIGWSAWQKRAHLRDVDTALRLPAGSTVADIKAAD
jgi:hypothetical protein